MRIRFLIHPFFEENALSRVVLVETPAQLSTKTRALLEPNFPNRNFFRGTRHPVRSRSILDLCPLPRVCLSRTVKAVSDPEIGPFRKALSSSSRMSG